MKQVLLITILGGMALSGAAQGLHITDDRLDKQVLALNLDGPAMATVEMKQELHLNEAQLNQVVQLNAQRYEQLQQAAALQAKNNFSFSKTVRSIHLASDQALQQVLTQEQLQHYLQLEGRQNMQFVSEKGNE